MVAWSGPIIDAHVHWWDVDAHPWYEYIRKVGETTGTDLHSNFLPSDYRRRIVDARVSKVVPVSAVPETRYYVDELRWLDGIVASSGFEVACVGSVDPSLDRDTLLNHLDAQYALGRLRGIRVLEGLEPDASAVSCIGHSLKGPNTEARCRVTLLRGGLDDRTQWQLL